jgi:hypothetical protein
MADPIDMILPLLGEMRSETAAGFATVNQRLDKLESALSGYRHALTADSLLSKLVTGEFEERRGVLEQKVRELESQK